jgi:uncharacterized Zn-binding protein involved in type VI secretion
MGNAAARITDTHTCPLSEGSTAHVGGPIGGPGASTVLIGGLVAAVVGDSCTCTGPTDSIKMGSTSVFIERKAAARLGDTTVHGGKITSGYTQVLIGG